MNPTYSENQNNSERDNFDDKNKFSNEKKSARELNPRKQVIMNILNYSKALRIEKSLTLNHFEMVLN